MAKHFIGLGLFSSIIGFFVLTSWLLSSGPAATAEVIEQPFSVTPRSYCNTRKRSKSVSTPRAIADRSDGTLTLYVNELPGSSRVNSNDVAARFTFYAVRGDQVRLVDVIHDSLVSSVRRDGGTKWTLRYQADWVSDLPGDETLYVVPSASDEPSHGAFLTAFSKDNAIPVLIRN